MRGIACLGIHQTSSRSRWHPVDTVSCDHIVDDAHPNKPYSTEKSYQPLYCSSNACVEWNVRTLTSCPGTKFFDMRYPLITSTAWSPYYLQQPLLPYHENHKLDMQSKLRVLRIKSGFASSTKRQRADLFELMSHISWRHTGEYVHNFQTAEIYTASQRKLNVQHPRQQTLGATMCL